MAGEPVASKDSGSRTARPKGKAVEAGDRVARHTDVGWFEWTLREFVRYMYFLGIFALILFGPLQMALSWLPYNRPAVIDPAIVGAMALSFVSSVLYLGHQGYRFLWREGGWVDRTVARREAAREEAGAGPGGPEG